MDKTTVDFTCPPVLKIVNPNLSFQIRSSQLGGIEGMQITFL